MLKFFISLLPESNVEVNLLKVKVKGQRSRSSRSKHKDVAERVKVVFSKNCTALAFKVTTGVHGAHLHQAYKHCFIRAVPSEFYGNIC